MPPRPQAKTVESITVDTYHRALADPLRFSLVAGEEGLQRRINDKSVNRPALAVTGYFKNFAAGRIQVFGAGEMAYLLDQDTERQREVMLEIVRKDIPCLVVSRGIEPPVPMVEAAQRFGVPLLRSPLPTRDVSNFSTLFLEQEFAPRIVQHGTLMDIRGIGTLLRGRSGVGKSECALALIERGHSLVADDVVYIRLLNEKELIGRSSDLNRGYMECRGIGIVNIADLFGIRSVRLQKNLNLVVTFEEWKVGMDEERTGLEQDYFEILGVRLPHMILPVRPGRDLARLVEVAAMVQALKQIGHDSAREFNERLINFMAQGGEAGASSSEELHMPRSD